MAFEHTTWSNNLSDATPFPPFTEAHERLVLMRVSKRRWVVARQESRGTANAHYHSPGLRGFAKFFEYEAVTIPLCRRDAMKALLWLLARECDRDTGLGKGNIPGDVRKWMEGVEID